VRLLQKSLVKAAIIFDNWLIGQPKCALNYNKQQTVQPALPRPPRSLDGWFGKVGPKIKNALRNRALHPSSH